MKLFGFSYQIGKALGVKIGCQEYKAKYVIPNPSPLSHQLELGEKQKLSLFDVDSDDEVISYEDGSVPRLVVMPVVDSANPLVELKGIDVVISDSMVEGKRTLVRLSQVN